MAFFNSLVNQIGREVGRDIYRSAKKSALSASYQQQPQIPTFSSEYEKMIYIRNLQDSMLVNQEMADTITKNNNNKLKKFIVTALGLNSIFYDFGVQKIQSFFSILWVGMAVLFYVAGYHTNFSGYIMGAICHSVPFLMAAWLRPKAKEYLDKVEEIKSMINLIKKMK